MTKSWTIYTKDECSYCRKAKELLDFLGEDYEEVNIKHPEYRDELFTSLEYMGIQKPWTLPQVWGPDGYLPGGYEGLQKYFE